MKVFNLSVITMAAGLLVAAPAFAQTPTPDTQAAAQKPHTQASSPATMSTASKVSKQRTDGDGPPMVGPASGAYKQRTDGDGPTMVGPASGAYKQRTQSLSHSDSGVMKQN